MSCPEENTCPIIDEVEECLNGIDVVTKDLIEHLAGKLDQQSITTISICLLILDHVNKANPLLDDIRIANAAIRSWGEEQEDEKLKRVPITSTVSGRF